MKRIECLFSPKHPYFWITSAVAIMAVILGAEIIRLYFLYDDCDAVKMAYNIFEGIAFSYIAAAIFQWIVVYIPHQRRKETIAPFIDRHIWKIKESLRECKTIPNPYSMKLEDNQQSKEKFREEFSKCNLEDDYIMKGYSKLDRINALKGKIECSVDALLSNKEYLTDEQFEFVNKIITSNFMQNLLVPNDQACKDESKNQNMIGECIYDLFEEAKKVCL